MKFNYEVNRKKKSSFITVISHFLLHWLIILLTFEISHFKVNAHRQIGLHLFSLLRCVCSLIALVKKYIEMNTFYSLIFRTKNKTKLKQIFALDVLLLNLYPKTLLQIQEIAQLVVFILTFIFISFLIFFILFSC